MAPALGLVKGRLDALPPKRRSEPEKRAVSVEPMTKATTSEQTTAPDAPTPRTPKEPRTKKPARTKSQDATGGMKRTTLSLPQDIVDLLTERRKNTPKISQVQLILNSLAATRHRLKDLVEADNAGIEGNDLFPVTSATRTVVGKRTTISFDTAEANMKIIDALVESSGASSRSQLVRVALRHCLAG